MGGGAGVNAQEIVQAAYQLLGAPYRQWHPGDPIPMWRKDGVGDPPPSSGMVFRREAVRGRSAII
jgi:hypothetical protein